MSDIREEILDRLLIILGAVSDVSAVGRNDDSLSERQGTTISLFDAGETTEDLIGSGKPPQSIFRMTMEPEIIVTLGTTPEAVGQELNNLRARVLNAILTDADLYNLVGKNGEVRYLGCDTDLRRGRDLKGEMQLGFSITYVVNPATL